MNKRIPREEKYKNVWIVFLHVSARNGNGPLKGYSGAFTNLIVYSKSFVRVYTIVRQKLSALGFKIKHILVIEYFPKRMEYYKISKKLLLAASSVNEQNNFAIGSEFASYP